MGLAGMSVKLPGAIKVGLLLLSWGRLLVSICSVPSLASSSLGYAPWKVTFLPIWICCCLLACRLALWASGCTISQAFLMLQATFMMALLLMTLGRLLTSLKS